MAILKAIFTSLLLVGLFAFEVSGIRCYHCYTSDCRLSFETNETMRAASETDCHRNSTVCYLLEQRHIVMRTCGFKRHKWQTLPLCNSSDPHISMCQCTEDLCNTGYLYHHQMTTPSTLTEPVKNSSDTLLLDETSAVELANISTTSYSVKDFSQNVSTTSYADKDLSQKDKSFSESGKDFSQNDTNSPWSSKLMYFYKRTFSIFSWD